MNTVIEGGMSALLEKVNTKEKRPKPQEPYWTLFVLLGMIFGCFFKFLHVIYDEGEPSIPWESWFWGGMAFVICIGYLSSNSEEFPSLRISFCQSLLLGVTLVVTFGCVDFFVQMIDVSDNAMHSIIEEQQ